MNWCIFLTRHGLNLVERSGGLPKLILFLDYWYRTGSRVGRFTCSNCVLSTPSTSHSKIADLTPKILSSHSKVTASLLLQVNFWTESLGPLENDRFLTHEHLFYFNSVQCLRFAIRVRSEFSDWQIKHRGLTTAYSPHYNWVYSSSRRVFPQPHHKKAP